MFLPITFFWPSYSAFKERHTFKILVVGEPNTGKRSLLQRFTVMIYVFSFNIYIFRKINFSIIIN